MNLVTIKCCVQWLLFSKSQFCGLFPFYFKEPDYSHLPFSDFNPLYIFLYGHKSSAELIFIYFSKANATHTNGHKNILRKTWFYCTVYYIMPALLNWQKCYAHITDDRKLNWIWVGRPVMALRWHKLIWKSTSLFKGYCRGIDTWKQWYHKVLWSLIKIVTIMY